MSLLLLFLPRRAPTPPPEPTGWRNLNKSGQYDLFDLQNGDHFALQDQDLFVLYFAFLPWTVMDKSASGGWTHLEKSE